MTVSFAMMTTNVDKERGNLDLKVEAGPQREVGTVKGIEATLHQGEIVDPVTVPGIREVVLVALPLLGPLPLGRRTGRLANGI